MNNQPPPHNKKVSKGNRNPYCRHVPRTFHQRISIQECLSLTTSQSGVCFSAGPGSREDRHEGL